MRLLRVTVTLLHLATLPVADSARILAVEMVAGKSHWNFMSGVLRALVDSGHVVTAFTPFPDGDRHNYTEVDISDTIIGFRDHNLTDTIAMWSDPVKIVGPLTAMSRELCDKVYANGRMVEVLRMQSSGASRFDLVITEPMLSECVSYVATQLDVPVIYVSPLSTEGLMQRYITGHFPNPAVVSHVMSTHSVPTTFVQRLVNAALVVHGLVANEFAAYRLRLADPRPYDTVALAKPSLVFVNGHSVMTAPSPITASVINVGGIHLTEAKRLPKDILEFIEQSTNGVIYFSFGSTVKMSSLPEHIKKAFLIGLSQLPQRVLMKYEELEDMPKNIMTKKWLPQRDILLHPNVKLFISHGGISGLYETIAAGVPILGFPLFGDQSRNIDYLVINGMAISMDLMTITKDSFLQNVLYLLNDKKYKQNAKNFSKIFKDRPMSPAQSVVYWTDYVIRHKGASHLKSHAFNLTWYQYFLLDVILTILILVFVVLFVTFRVLKLGYKYVVYYPKRIKTKSE